MILKTKLQIPQVKSSVLERERCLNILKDSMDRRLILINAAAGYGKTTLLSQFIAWTNLPCVFYHLDASDSELTLFFSYLNTAFKQINPRFGRRLATVLRTVAASVDNMEMIAGTFINEFVEHMGGDTFIVLDDYHHIHPSCQIDRSLDYMLQNAPPNLHMVIATRQRPALALTKLKARAELAELTNHDLRFDRREIDRLVKEVHGISLNRKELRALEGHSEGWVTSLQLILQTTRQDLRERLRTCTVSRRQRTRDKWWSDYFNYFAQEIFEREPVRTRRFMVSISILEWLDHDVCKAITGRSDSAQILRCLEQKNAFVSRMPNGNYRFHNLFRDFLLSKWPDTRSRQRALVRAAKYFCSHGRTAAAIPYFLEAGHFIRAARSLRTAGYEMTNAGKGSTVVSHIERLPRVDLDGDPELLMVYSYAKMSGGCPNEAIGNLTRAIRLMAGRKKRTKDLAQAYYDLGSIYFNLGRFDSAKRCLTKALRTSPTRRALSNAAMMNSLGLIYSKAGGHRFRDAAECFRKASGIVRRFSENKGLEASIINNWAMTERKSGNLIAAHGKISGAVRLLRQEANFSPQFGSIFYNAVRLSVCLGKTTQAAAVLKLGLELCGRYNDRCSLAIIWRGYAAYYEELGDLNASIEYLRKAVPVFESLGLTRMICLAHKDLCRVYTCAERLAEAEQSLGDVWRLKKTRDDADAVSLHIIEARLRIAQARIHEAEDVLARAERLAHKYGLRYELFLALLERARSMHAGDREADACKVLRRTAKMSADNSYDHTLSKFMTAEKWSIGHLMAIDRTYASTVIKRWSVPYHSVEIFLFGTPRVIIDGKEVEPSAWKTVKALKLFCHVCSHRHRMIARDVLIEALWRNASPRSGARNLRKAMHHIRQALGTVIDCRDNPVIYRNKCYQLAPDFAVWLDTEEFEDLIRKAKEKKEDRPRYISRALDLYQDGYGQGWYEDWVEAKRGYHARHYEECLAVMADIAMRRDDFRKSAALCQRLVAHAPYDESYRRKLWRALAGMEKLNDVKKDFSEFKKALRKELKTEPQRQTIEYYNSIVK